ncbi:MAM and LDL-receptor class A domain-containing protein 1, partial [Lingula anatina]|uniref:MAM and LDL-receptor class A domain-containing protein 1 n=1 Tax=Lingula anatina TaxID=7574 RepID=A0A1S3I227_LINAN
MARPERFLAVYYFILFYFTTGQRVNGKEAEVECTFNEQWCNFTQLSLDNMQWTLGRNGDGGFAHVIANTTSKTDAVMGSPPMPPLYIPRGLAFQYRQIGVSLTIDVAVMSGNATQIDVIWSSHSPDSAISNGTWRHARVTLPPAEGTGTLGDIVVFFNASSTGSTVLTHSSLSLDNVVITRGPCDAGEPVFRMLSDISEMTCTFEKDQACTYHDYVPPRLVNKTTITWTIHQGYTLSSRTGPTGDHTFTDHKGRYIYLEASGIMPDTTATIKFELNPPMSLKCAVFFYHMWGYVVGSLRVFTLKDDSPFDETLLWKQSGNHRNVWHEARVDVPANSTAILFQAVRGTSNFGDIALDDVMVVNGVCADNQRPLVNITMPPATTTTMLTKTSSTTTTSKAFASTTPSTAATSATPKTKTTASKTTTLTTAAST